MATESVVGTYMSLDGVEILNDSRTVAYMRNDLGPPGLSVTGDCGCPNMRELIGCDPDYISPSVDGVPWVTSSYPESADFLGFLVSDFSGLGSTLTRQVYPTVTEGAVLGRLRPGERPMTWSVYLIGRTCCATAYGLRWLTRQLSGGSACAPGCTLSTLDLMTCCPEFVDLVGDGEGELAPGTEDDIDGTCGGGYADTIYGSPSYGGPDETVACTVEPFPPTPSSNDQAFRTLYQVGLIEGPLIKDQRRVNCGCGGAEVLQVEFTIVASKPYLYQNSIVIANQLPLSFGVPTTAVNETPCELVDCTFNPACLPADTPPTPVLTDNCFVNPVLPTATRISVPRSFWPDLTDVVPIITIYSGTQPLHSTTLGFYLSDTGDPCGDYVNNVLQGPILCNPLCGIIKIPYMAADSTLVIDGRINKMSLVCALRAATLPGEKITIGEWGWPSFDCTGFCMELVTDQSFLNANATVTLELVPRSL